MKHDPTDHPGTRTWSFRLIVEGVDIMEPTTVDALYAAGCSDATIGRTNGVQHIDFDRVRVSLGRAILDAVHDVQRGAPDARIVGIENAECAECESDRVSVACSDCYAGPGPVTGDIPRPGLIDWRGAYLELFERTMAWGGDRPAQTAARGRAAAIAFSDATRLAADLEPVDCALLSGVAAGNASVAPEHDIVRHGLVEANGRTLTESGHRTLNHVIRTDV